MVDQEKNQIDAQEQTAPVAEATHIDAAPSLEAAIEQTTGSPQTAPVVVSPEMRAFEQAYAGYTFESGTGWKPQEGSEMYSFKIPSLSVNMRTFSLESGLVIDDKFKILNDELIKFLKASNKVCVRTGFGATLEAYQRMGSVPSSSEFLPEVLIAVTRGTETKSRGSNPFSEACVYTTVPLSNLDLDIIVKAMPSVVGVDNTKISYFDVFARNAEETQKVADKEALIETKRLFAERLYGITSAYAPLADISSADAFGTDFIDRMLGSTIPTLSNDQLHVVVGILAESAFGEKTVVESLGAKYDVQQRFEQRFIDVVNSPNVSKLIGLPAAVEYHTSKYNQEFAGYSETRTELANVKLENERLGTEVNRVRTDLQASQLQYTAATNLAKAQLAVLTDTKSLLDDLVTTAVPSFTRLHLFGMHNGHPCVKYHPGIIDPIKEQSEKIDAVAQLTRAIYNISANNGGVQ